MTPHVGESTDRSHRSHQNQEVAQTHPGHRTHTGVERPLQGGQGHGHDAGVELAHEGPDADRGHGQPEGIGPTPIASGRLGSTTRCCHPTGLTSSSASTPSIVPVLVRER